MNRRQLMVVSASTIAASMGTAGCLDRLSGSTPSDSTEMPAENTPTQTGTPTGTLDQLALDATVTEEASQETPAMISTALTNTGEAPVRVGTGPTLVFRTEGHAFDQGILLYPETDIGPNDTPDEPTDGCWRYTDDDFLEQDSLDYQTIASGEAINETHSVYTIGDDGPCLPEEEYVFADEVVGANEAPTLTLEVTLTIDKDGKVAVTADEMGQ